MAIFLGLGSAAFGLQLTGSWWASVPLLVVGTLCFMAVGLFAGATTTTVEGAVNMANFLVLPMAFLSGSFFPLDAAPAWLQSFAKVLPLYWLNEGMLDVLVRGRGPGRGAAADGDPGRVRRRADPAVGAAVPVGDQLVMGLLFETPRARLRRRLRRVGPESRWPGGPCW